MKTLKTVLRLCVFAFVVAAVASPSVQKKSSHQRAIDGPGCIPMPSGCQPG